MDFYGVQKFSESLIAADMKSDVLIVEIVGIWWIYIYVSGTRPGFVHCGILITLYMSHYLG